MISSALKSGGRHLIDVMNGDYARIHFPCKLWDAGDKGLTLSQFEWDEDSKTLLYGPMDFRYGQILQKPEILEGNPTGLYTVGEISQVFSSLGMRVIQSFADFSDKCLKK